VTKSSLYTYAAVGFVAISLVAIGYSFYVQAQKRAMQGGGSAGKLFSGSSGGEGPLLLEAAQATRDVAQLPDTQAAPLQRPPLRQAPLVEVPPPAGLSQGALSSSAADGPRTAREAGVVLPPAADALQRPLPPATAAPQATEPAIFPPEGASPLHAAPSTNRAPLASQGGALPTPREQQAASKPFMEGHWNGMELLEIVPELAREYKLPAGLTGLLVDEVSLEAAESGLLAGDVVFQIGELLVSTLHDVLNATYQVRNAVESPLGIVRNGQRRMISLRAGRALGFAMFEAASPIAPGAISPHKRMGLACTDCHIIMSTGGQLAIDAGDIMPSPPPIAADASPPHGNRGPCNTCHRVAKSANNQ
jgi:hypothetical protein